MERSARRSSYYANDNNDTTTTSATTLLDASLLSAGLGALVLTGNGPTPAGAPAGASFVAGGVAQRVHGRRGGGRAAVERAVGGSATGPLPTHVGAFVFFGDGVSLILMIKAELARAEHGVDCVPLVVALLRGDGAVKGGERAAALGGQQTVRVACFGAPDVAREGGVQAVLAERAVEAD